VIAELAATQHGVVARRQLLDSGLTRRQIEERISRHLLHPIHHGVYAVGHTALTDRGRWSAAVLACGPRAVLSHRAAGQLWRLIPQTRLLLEVTRPGRSRRRPGIRTWRGSVREDEQGTIDGIKVTSLSRTIVDLAAVLERPRLERALNEAEVLRLTDRLSVPELLDRHPGRRGVATLREILADELLMGITREALEERFLTLLRSRGLPSPRLNTDLIVRGRHFNVDCLWTEARLLVELDGHAVHGTKRAFERDRERDRLLLLDGWRVTRVTWRQLREDPDRVAAEIGELLSHSPGPTLWV
jgi:very-short-patch-repair endonuclease/predicted transcriptional regulator of viral defense system